MFKLKILLSGLILISLISQGTYFKRELDLDDKDRRPTEVPRVETQGQLIIPDQGLKETIILKEEIIKLRKDLSEQKEQTSKLLERINDLISNQSLLISDLKNTIQVFQNFSTTALTLSQQNTYKDAFILNKEGKPIAFVDAGLKLYEYTGGNLIGWIKPDTNEVVRNTDNSVIGIIENDFIVDESGYPIGSIERSETLRWDREKLYGKIQKKPASHFFARPQSPRKFILSTFRSSDWSTQKLEDLLYFSEKEIQKLK